MAEIMLSHRPDVACVTEGQTNWLANMHACFSTADHGYARVNPNERKVILFSRNPWTDVDTIGHPDLPPGRFVAATTETPIGPFRFVGVCIPWRAAHVSTGNRNRTPWQDHKTYLSALRTIIAQLPDNAIVLGDYNQRLPRQGQPSAVAELLIDTLGSRLAVMTSGVIEEVADYAIDHLACTAHLSVSSLTALPKVQNDLKLSDHFGLIVNLQPN